MLPVPIDGGGGGDPPAPGGVPTHPPQPDTVLAVQVSSTNVTFTSEQIAAAGGPWLAFSVRVTPLNVNGAGAPQTVDVPASP